MTLDGKMKAHKIDLRGAAPDHIQKKANEIFRKICTTASGYEASGDGAREVADAAIYKHSVAMAGFLGSLHACVDGGLSSEASVRDRAAKEADKIFAAFKKDMADYLVQQVVELRSQRGPNA